MELGRPVKRLSTQLIGNDLAVGTEQSGELALTWGNLIGWGLERQ